MKTVTFDDEAYDILRHLKLSPGDSFSDVVKRHLGASADKRLAFDEAFGAWSDMTDAEVRGLRERMVTMFGTTGGNTHAGRRRKRPR